MKYRYLILILFTALIIFAIGYHISYTMLDEIEKEQIERIGPPGITNLLPIVIIVLVSAFVLELILWLSKRGKDITNEV